MRSRYPSQAASWALRASGANAARPEMAASARCTCGAAGKPGPPLPGHGRWSQPASRIEQEAVEAAASAHHCPSTHHQLTTFWPAGGGGGKTYITDRFSFCFRSLLKQDKRMPAAAAVTAKPLAGRTGFGVQGAQLRFKQEVSRARQPAGARWRRAAVP